MESSDRSEIVFFDVETTIPTRPGQGYALLEFGAILVCPRKLVELASYSTLIRPNDLSLISGKSERCNGITSYSVSNAPPFSAIADHVFDLLHGRIWAGHNILRFDCVRIQEAFAEIGRLPPEPKGAIDTLTLLTERFGRRAGNMKMATLASYFGLGHQMHRSLDDVRMNLEVLKYCATVLFLESSLPDILANSFNSPNTARRTRNGGRVLPEDNSGSTPENGTNQMLGEKILNIVDTRPETESFNLRRLSEEIMVDAVEDNPMEERPTLESLDEGCSSSSSFLTPEDVSIPSISASLVPFYRGSRRIQIIHKDVVLKLVCTHLKVRFGISTKFVDQAGRPRLSFVVDAPQGLCQVLDACDTHAKSMFMQSGSTSDWRPVVSRKNGYWNFPTVRLNVPTVITGDVAKYGAEIFQKEATSSTEQKLLFSKFDAAELETLFTPGTFVDAFFSLDPFDYQQNAGIRLVAEKLVIHSK
ncbi:hypothetical protein Cgig2_017795 [Carnegiea gigantea]|uniref:Exonuclease domain-containing protein n=1 Tax=Carnegiea gigantea TaxID=171969 RepID=A0A9Q1KYU5_9CARY|nr:hypothetical protein Cgig2_017795 [Carnegiea gigantea]